MSWLRTVSIKKRFFLIALVVVLGLIVVSLFAYNATKFFLMEGKERAIQDFSESALNIVEHYYDEAQSGRLSESEAKQLARTAIDHMRYANGEYVWINDFDHIFILQPAKPELEGTSAYDVKDRDGVYLIRDAVNIARNEGSGFLRYHWTKPSTRKVAPKMSFVRGFKPWQWVLGSGIYLDDVNAELQQQAFTLASTSLVVMACLLLVLWIISDSITRPLNKTVERMREIASGDGDLTVQLSTEGRDELSEVSLQFNMFVGKIRELISNVQSSIEQVSSSADGLLEATRATAENMLKQQSETDQVASAMNEMSSSAHEIAQNAEFASNSAEEANNESSKSRDIVTHTLKTVDELAGEMDSTTAAIEKLEAESENIGNVLTVIQGIAEQTNLLALNAAIEAARAGELGRGFAVVADEVRALAQKTQTSTQEINSMIDNLQSGATAAVNAMSQSLQKTRSTVESAHRAENALDVVSSAIGSINDMNSQIAVASEQQSQVAEEINKNVNTIVRLSDENREASERVLGLSEGLRQVGSSLRSYADRFVV